VFTPVRYKADLVFNRIQGILTQTFGIHADEPLWCRTKDNRGFMAPAMRVAMLDHHMCPKLGCFSQCCNDFWIGFVDVLARQDRRHWYIHTITTDWVFNL